MHKLLSVVYALIFMIPSVATATEASKYFEIGVEAAQQQQYHVALKAFLQAKTAGLDSPELKYNIAVVHYKLGQFKKANKNFQLLTDNEQYSAIASYNLGLVALKQNKRAAAQQWFEKAYATANDPKIITLAAKAMDRLKGIKVPVKLARRAWKGFVSTNIGYDSNVASMDEVADQTQGPSDLNAEFLATTSRMLWGDKNNGFRFNGNVYLLEHNTEHEYDYTQWHTALSYLVSVKGWNIRSSLSVDQTRFANIDYLRLNVLSLQGRYSLRTNTRLELRYKYYDVDDIGPNNEYEYLQGVKQQLRARINHKAGDINWRLLYAYEHNDRQDSDISFLKPDPNDPNDPNANISVQRFRSYSPIRHTAQVMAKLSLNKNTKIFLDTQYRNSNYQNADTTIENGTVMYERIREDNRYRMTLGAEHELNDKWELLTYYQFTKNNSNRERSDYERSQVAVGVTWFY